MGKSRAEYMRLYRQKKREEILKTRGEQPKKMAKSSTQRSRDFRARIRLSSLPFSSSPSTSTETECNTETAEVHLQPADVKQKRVAREDVEYMEHDVNNFTGRKLSGQPVMVTLLRPLFANPPSQCTGNKNIPFSVNSDGSTCHTKQDVSSACLTIKKEIEFKSNIVTIVPVEFETSSKLDKECLVDEFYPKILENTFICNRFVYSDEKTCDVEVQTHIGNYIKVESMFKEDKDGRNFNTNIKVESVFKEDMYSSKIEFTPDDVHHCKKEPPEVLNCKVEPLESIVPKRECSPEFILP